MTVKIDSEQDLCYLSACQAMALFRDKKLSPVELLQALIKRAEAVEPKINAFAFDFYDEALDKARKAESKFAKKNGRIRALEGIPLAVKDEMDIKGKPMTNGSLYLKDNISSVSHYSVERLLRAGAIVHARTTTPEFSCTGVTHSRLYGVTGTPWKPAYTCGGSSGGSGAALAAGTTILATGSDVGGSIRVPAAACGVVGYKPPHGRNPFSGPLAYSIYYAMGPMARTVDDCILMQNVMSGPHPLVNSSVRPKYRIPRDLKGIVGWKIAYSIDLDHFRIDPQVRHNTERTLEVLRGSGAIVEPVDFGWSAEIDRATQDYVDYLFGGHVAAYIDSDPSLASEWAKQCAIAHKKVTAEAFIRAYELQDMMACRIGRILENYHALICPTMGSHEVPADHEPDQPLYIDGEAIDEIYGWSLCHPFNMLGRCPVLAVPSGLADNGLPTGIQIVARHFDDVRVFQVAAALERAQPWLDCPERRPNL